MKDYEVVYIFDSQLTDEQVTERIDRFHGLLTNEAAEITAVDHWGRRQLAYEIEDHENGYYVVTHFKTAADKLPEFERLLKLDDDLLRYLIVVNEGDLPTTPAPIVEPGDDEDSDEEEE